MSPSQELSNIYGSNTNLVEVPTVLVGELYSQLKDAIWDLENELSNLDVSNAADFIDELVNILTSHLTAENLIEHWQWGYQAPLRVIQVNLPFTKAQLLRLTRNAFASLLCDRAFSRRQSSYTRCLPAALVTALLALPMHEIRFGA